jgi:hypothetical protein
MTHCNEMIYQQVTLSGYAEWPKVADAVIEAPSLYKPRQHLVYLSVHVSRPCWIGGRPLISMIGLSHDKNTFCLYAAPLLVKPSPIE